MGNTLLRHFRRSGSAVRKDRSFSMAVRESPSDLAERRRRSEEKMKGKGMEAGWSLSMVRKRRNIMAGGGIFQEGLQMPQTDGYSEMLNGNFVAIMAHRWASL